MEQDSPQPVPQDISPHKRGALDSPQLSDLRDICNALETVKHKWQKIAIQLGIPYHKQEDFKKEEDPLAAVIYYWLKGNVEDIPHWESIVTALKSPHVGEIGLARSIGRKHCPQKIWGKIRMSDAYFISPQPGMTFPTPEEQDETLEAVKIEVLDLQKDFRSIIQQTRKCLKDENKNISNILDTLEYNIPDKLFKVYLDKTFKQLEKSKTFRDFFTILRECCNFLDFHLMQYIVEEHGDGQLKVNMNCYLRKLEQFRRKRTVYQLIKCGEIKYRDSEIPEDCIRYASKLQRDPKECMVEELEELLEWSTEFADPITKVALVLVNVIANSITVVWVVTSAVVPMLRNSIVQLIQRDPEFIERKKIAFFVLDDYILYPEGATEKFWNACREGNFGEVKNMLESADMDLHHKEEVSGWNLLHCIARHGHISVLDLLLGHQGIPEIDTRDKRGCTAVLLAAQAGHERIVCSLLKKGANPNIQDNDKKTALMTASELGHDGVVVSLLEANSNVNYQTEDKLWSALFFASKAGHTGTIKLLIEYGADVNLKDMEGKTAADYAANKQVLSLIKKKVGPLEGFVKSPWTSIKKLNPFKNLLTLSSRGDCDAIRHLLDQETPNVNMKDSLGITPLMTACYEGHYEVAKLLIENGADVNMSNKENFSALKIACSRNFVRIAYLLLEKGADPDNLESKSNTTPLMWISDTDYVEAARALLKYGARPDWQSEQNGWTVLMQAAHFGQKELVELYLDYGEEGYVNMTGNKGWTALMSAARKNRADIARILIERGASLGKEITGAKKQIGEQALHVASYMDSPDVVRVLIEHGADVNQTNKAGLTPLMIATNRGNVKAVDALLESETIDVDIKHEITGLPALFLAAKNGEVEIFKKLLQHGAKEEVDAFHVFDVAQLFKRKAIIAVLKKHKSDKAAELAKEETTALTLPSAPTPPVTPTDTPTKELTTTEAESTYFLLQRSFQLFMKIMEGYGGHMDVEEVKLDPPRSALA